MTTASIASIAYRVEIRNGRHELTADEPLNLGGGDTGPTPDELLEAALASCTAITLRMYANRKEWPVTEINVAVYLERKDDKTIFTRNIQIEGTIDEAQKERLLQIAKACPVSKTLSGSIDIKTQIV
ncbi:MAG: OsmC family peroxiredoxin [Chitinophagaceae bacterium]|nr:MAG: OsmC family peroxiredoxin [Chitinophagaceae bacterium]